MSWKTRLARWLLGPPPSLIGPPTPYQLERMTDLARIALAEGRPSAPIPAEWVLALLTAHREMAEREAHPLLVAMINAPPLDAKVERELRDYVSTHGRKFTTAPTAGTCPGWTSTSSADVAMDGTPDYLVNVMRVPPSAVFPLRVSPQDVAMGPDLVRIEEQARKAGAEFAKLNAFETFGSYVPLADAVKAWAPPAIGGFTANRDGGCVECAAFLAVGANTDAAVEAFNANCAEALNREGGTWEAEGTPMVRVSRSWRKVDFDPEVRPPYWKVPK